MPSFPVEYWSLINALYFIAPKALPSLQWAALLLLDHVEHTLAPLYRLEKLRPGEGKPGSPVAQETIPISGHRA